MLPLLRPEFRPERWTAEDLDAAAEHWLWLFDRSPHTAGKRAEHRTALRLYGFPRAAAHAVIAALESRLPSFTVTAADPDWVRAIGPDVDFDLSAESGLGLPKLHGPPFDGLYAELRLTATAAGVLSGPKVVSTLVLAGELLPDGFRFYTAWREGDSAIMNDAMTGAAWPDFDAWRENLAEHREGDAHEYESRPLAERCFPLASTDRHVNRILWLIMLPPFGKPRGPGTLARLAVNSLILAAAVALAVVLGAGDPVTEILRALAVILAAVPLVYLLGRLAIEFTAVKTFGTGQFAKLYADPVRITPIPPTAAAEFTENPTARKLAAEYEAAGCRHLGDAVVEPHMADCGMSRTYVAADGCTYVCLVTMIRIRGADGDVRHELWPAQVTPLLLTRFPNVGRAGTTNDTTAAFRRKLSGPESALRVHPGVTDPAELLAKHAELCRWYSEKFGVQPLPAESFDAFRTWQEEVSEEERRNYGPNPVTWSDAFVMLMGYTRKAYRPGPR